ncbi:MAG: bifunctional 5,10-methylenetetrahydrofolate dehydrogenase/5,10-methenyltetrahydrofolate cyclohydrolase [Candidatus Magasanikbacteria bacterium]|nr:bifunctional 5,10-methylenetetrahydrofolate dehydrogenase/5,10-methenyltetrahydrofolate cyclohydrolase [Candidatus Magasanikbacteria bacterium]
MSQLINGKTIADRILEQTKTKVEELKKQGAIPSLAVLLVGDDKPSKTYVSKKGEAARNVGINFKLHQLPPDAGKNLIISKVEEIQSQENPNGLIVQLPLPYPEFTAEVLNAINPLADVDCLTNINLGKLVMNTQSLLPPTPAAVLEILKELKIELPGKNVTIIGMGALVGKPLAIMMMNARASLSTCNSITRDTREKCLRADIIITGVGKFGILSGDMVSDGAVIIDTGVDFVNKKMTGDVDVQSFADKNVWITPTPGGVGPITVAKLLSNTVLAASLKAK